MDTKYKTFFKEKIEIGQRQVRSKSKIKNFHLLSVQPHNLILFFCATVFGTQKLPCRIFLYGKLRQLGLLNPMSTIWIPSSQNSDDDDTTIRILKSK